MAGAVALFAVYGTAFTPWLGQGQPAWGLVEPVPALAASVLLAVWLVRTRADAVLFLGALAAFIAVAGFGIGVVQLVDSSPLPVVPFYSSRMLVAGAIVVLYGVCAESRAPALMVMGAALAGLLIFAGLSSNMRVAAVFYALAWLLTSLFLAAQRNYAAILIGVVVLVGAYVAHGALKGQHASDKWNAYSPTITREDAPPAPTFDKAACLGKSAKLLQGRNPDGQELRHMCNRFFTLDDQDGRMRLILHAAVSNPSPLFGAGLGRYEFIDAARPRSEADRYTYPHNILAEAYHATGLIGLGLIGFAIGAAIVLALRACLARGTPLAVFMTVPAFTAMAAMTGGNLYDARLLWIVPVAMTALARPNPTQEADG
jgi:hypothetical protein